MYCSNCGAECLDGAQFCIKCGQRLEYDKEKKVEYGSNGIPVQPEITTGTTYKNNDESLTGRGAIQNNSGDASSFGYAVLGFFIPIAGLILYLVWREQTPFRAKSAGKGALVGVIVWVGLSVILTILSVLLPMMILRGY